MKASYWLLPWIDFWWKKAKEVGIPFLLTLSWADGRCFSSTQQVTQAKAEVEPFCFHEGEERL